MCENLSPDNQFQVGDIVYIVGKRSISSCAPVVLVSAKISHMHRSQYVAYEIDANGVSNGQEWRFSRKNIGLSVFGDILAATNSFHNIKRF